MPRPKNSPGHRILVVNEKHATRYFDAATDALLHAAALTLITERLDEEAGACIFKPDPPTKPDALSDEQIAALPTEALRKLAARDTKERRAAEREYRNDRAQYENAVAAVKTADGALAYRVLQQRAGYEYEGFHLEYLES